MRGIRERIREIGWILAMVLVGVVVGSLAAKMEATAPERLIAVLCAAIIVLQLRILYQMLSTGEPVPVVLTEVRAALDRAGDMQRPARTSIWATWTSINYDETLKRYFAETLSKGVQTTRIIDMRSNTIDHILDHIRESWQRIQAATYEVFVTYGVAYELLVVDHSRAAIFHFPGPDYGAIFVTHNVESFATNVRGAFERMKSDSSRFPTERFSAQFDEGEVREWLEYAKQELRSQ